MELHTGRLSSECPPDAMQHELKIPRYVWKRINLMTLLQIQEAIQEGDVTKKKMLA